MRNFDTSILNAIRDNLRNRYDDGFPILKELIQNADDAEAGRLRFGWHTGFDAGRIDHPLLASPALWFWNDGRIKPGDIEALCSFGINAKAADAGAIGKFGLGMKSVFHLCEAFFFVGWQGNEFRQECLSPWEHRFHPDWDETARDWDELRQFGQACVNESSSGSGHWFLLWLPLRQARQLKKPDGTPTSAIMQRFPGDHPDQDLAFLREADLASRLAEIMPLLHHLSEIEAKGGHEAVSPFKITLLEQERLERVDGDGTARGRVELSNGLPTLGFCGQQRDMAADPRFVGLKERPEWPPVFVLNNATGEEEQKEDKARPEGAVLFARANDGSLLTLRWAVFLPLSDREEVVPILGGDSHFRLTLHGQFFVDSGRRDVFDWEALFETLQELDPQSRDETELRRAWNAELFQRVLAPLVLPALADFAEFEVLSDQQCRALTQALAEADVYKRAKKYLCGSQSWCRCLGEQTGVRWRRIEGADLETLRPLPPPPQSDPTRPWSVFSELKNIGVLAFDAEAPRLGAPTARWHEDELRSLLKSVDGILSDGPRSEYFQDFLEEQSCAKPYLNTEWLQRQLISLLRRAFLSTDAADWGMQREKMRRLISLVHPERRHHVDAEFPALVWKSLLRHDALNLLVPHGFEPPESRSSLKAEGAVILPWLNVLDQAVATLTDAKAMEPLLSAAAGLLRTLPEQPRGAFLHTHPDLRILSVRDVQGQREHAVSLGDLKRVLGAGTLFSFAGGVGGGQYGFAPLLAKALPEAEVWLISVSQNREFVDQTHLAKADAQAAMLAAVAQSKGPLGSSADRRALLEKANDPGNDALARRGLRLLLHGGLEHRDVDAKPLWVPRDNQHSAWAKLWRQLHSNAYWSVLERDLAGCLPANRWALAGIQEIAPETLLGELRAGLGIPDAAAFDVSERDEILAQISERDLWQRLPLHTSCDSEQAVSLVGQMAYLAPGTGCPEDALTRSALIIQRSGNPTQAAKQNQPDWLRPLDDRALIEIALSSDTPMEHWRWVLDALDRLPETVVTDLASTLRSVDWLPTKFDVAINPEDVLALPTVLHDDAKRLVAEHRARQGACFAVPEELPDTFRQHPAFPLLEENTFSRGLAGLERLALLLQDLPGQQIGNWDRQPDAAMVVILADYLALPGWRLLRDAAAAFEDSGDAPVIWQRLRDGITGQLGADQLLAVLDWLTSNATDWGARKGAVDVYLKQLTQLADRPEDWLIGLRLASQQHSWLNSTSLCAGATGVDPGRVLDERQAIILDNLIHRAEQRSDSANALLRSSTIGFAQTLEVATDTFESNFASWRGLVEPAMVGVVAGMLGIGLRLTAEDWLHPHSFKWLKDDLRSSWRDPGYDRTGRREWMAGRTLDQALEVIASGLVLTDGDAVELPNLLGETLQVPLQSVDDIAHLVAGAPAWKRDYEEPYWVQVRLRRIDPAAQPLERLTDLLRRTSEYLYRHFYEQRQTDFGALWQKLEKTRQLDVATARRMILDNIPFYLGQLALRDDGLKTLLGHCDTAQQRLAELEEGAIGDQSQQWAQARNEERIALDRLGRAIEDQPALNAAVLEGVRSRIRDSKYHQSSIPFELFQNADDACVELGQIHAHPDRNGCNIPGAARRMVVEIQPEKLRLLHWGRPLNDRGPKGFAGDERGFGRDLRKMLVLSASDKHPESGVTGRLGLGFKSVFLACDRPRIVSGRLAVEIVGGLLPIPWKDCANARACLRDSGKDAALTGTLVELASADVSAQRKVLERFERLAGVLCVFGRAIRQIEFRSPGGTEPRTRHVHWSPDLLEDDLEFGRLYMASENWGGETGALCLRTAHGSLLMALDPHGFRALPTDVPAVWVTAPSSESTSVGFAINGPFELDPGRARLDAESAGNLKRARDIGCVAGDAIARLLRLSVDDWHGCRNNLQLAADLRIHDFWRSLWIGLTTGWLGRQRDPAGALARAAVCALLEALAAKPGAVPTGLPAPLGAMTSRGELRFELDASLSTISVVTLLSAWPRFTTRFPPTATVSDEIGAILKHLELACLTAIKPLALLRLCDNDEFEPDDAYVLGKILQETEDTVRWDREDLRVSLERARFRAENGAWAEARRLLTSARTGSGCDIAEELLRFAVAPADRRLHPKYACKHNVDAIEFFLHCRRQMAAPARDLSEWVLAAEADTEQIAALKLLACSNIRAEIAPLVRGRAWVAKVLSQLDLLQAAELTTDELAELRRLLASDDAIGKAVSIETDPSLTSTEGWGLDLATGLQCIFDWWAREGQKRIAPYRERLYPWELSLGEDTEKGRFDRSSWLTLFALGAFQSLQWPNDDRNRLFLKLCDARGWWRTFAEVDPTEQPDQWMDIIEDYAQSQHADEEWTLWVAQFPKLYRLARWLDDYVGLFQSIERFSEPFLLENVLASRVSEVYDGGSYDAPPVNRTLKVGGQLVIRELLHHGILSNPHAVRHAYALTGPIRRLFESFGETLQSAGEIHKLLVQHLGSDQATFLGSYDIPLRLVAAREDCQREAFGSRK